MKYRSRIVAAAVAAVTLATLVMGVPTHATNQVAHHGKTSQCAPGVKVAASASPATVTVPDGGGQPVEVIITITGSTFTITGDGLTDASWCVKSSTKTNSGTGTSGASTATNKKGVVQAISYVTIYSVSLEAGGTAGIDWVSRTSAAANSWRSVAYGTPGGNGIFVAVATSGTGNRVMTSPDGTTWTIRTSAADYSWRSVTYGMPGGNPLFVAVTSSFAAEGNQVMTSPDGINWTLRSTPTPAGQWQSVTYGNGKFVAVSDFEFPTGLNGRSMTSTDGINWTVFDAPDDSTWSSVTYGEPGGNPLFVAVAYDYVSATNVVMTSPDGETWTARTGFPNNEWSSVVWADGKFVAVSKRGINVNPIAPGRVMWSLDGVDWNLVDPPVDTDGPQYWEESSWTSVVYGAGLFVAVGYGGLGQRVMTSPDGATWTLRNSAADNTWNAVAFGGGRFVAVASGCPSGGVCVDNRVMTSP